MTNTKRVLSVGMAAATLVLVSFPFLESLKLVFPGIGPFLAMVGIVPGRARMDCPSIWSKRCRAGDGSIYCLMEAEVVPCNRTANLEWHILYHWNHDSGIVPF